MKRQTRFSSPSNQSFADLDDAIIPDSPTVEVVNLVSDSLRGDTLTIYMSNDPQDYSKTSVSPNESTSQLESTKSTRKLDKIVIKNETSTESPPKKTTPSLAEIPHSDGVLLGSPPGVNECDRHAKFRLRSMDRTTLRQ